LTAITNWLRQVFLPLALIALGSYLVWESKSESGWIGVALISLGLFYRLIDGQKLSSFGFGPNGVTIELLERRIDEVERKADAAAESGGQLQFKSAEVDLIGELETARWSDRTVRVIGDSPEDDNQKNQWGGQSRRGGRMLLASVEESTNNSENFWIKLTVRPVQGAPAIEGAVRFHLHKTYPRETVIVQPVNGEAHIERYAYGAFTVGAEVMDEPDTFLELDLSQLQEVPEKFRSR